jgi:putative ABC transport system permease protein
VFRYALTSLRANLTRLVATALAVIIGITFLGSGLMLTDAMRAGLTADIERQYAALDLAVEPSQSIESFGGPAGLSSVAPDVLDAIRDTPGVAAVGQPAQPGPGVDRGRPAQPRAARGGHRSRTGRGRARPLARG